MGVMLQAFYWDCPKAEDREYQWWAFIESKLPSIAQAGFTRKQGSELEIHGLRSLRLL